MLCRSWSLRAIGYPVAGLCLITYETALLPLLAVPLLDGWASGVTPFSDPPGGRCWTNRSTQFKHRPPGGR